MCGISLVLLHPFCSFLFLNCESDIVTGVYAESVEDSCKGVTEHGGTPECLIEICGFEHSVVVVVVFVPPLK